MTPAQTKRREERFKLASTFASNTGVGSMVAGGIAPAFGAGFDGLVFGVAIGIGVTLHLVGQALLHYVVADAAEEAS